MARFQKRSEEQFIFSELSTDLLDEGDYLLLRLQRVESAYQGRVLLSTTCSPLRLPW